MQNIITDTHIIVHTNNFPKCYWWTFFKSAILKIFRWVLNWNSCHNFEFCKFSSLHKNSKSWREFQLNTELKVFKKVLIRNVHLYNSESLGYFSFWRNIPNFIVHMLFSALKSHRAEIYETKIQKVIQFYELSRFKFLRIYFLLIFQLTQQTLRHLPQGNVVVPTRYLPKTHESSWPLTATFFVRWD